MASLSIEQIRNGIVTLIALILSISVHEFAHAWVADRLGDRTPRLQGRVTLNPMAHADPFGTLLFPAMGLFMMGGMMFGWGRPVEVNPLSFTRRMRMKTSHMLVAAAGPVSNIVFGILISLVLLALIKTGVPMRLEVKTAILSAIYLNFILAMFNFLPLPPLDGGTVLAGVLPDRHRPILEFLERYGMWILLGLLVTNSKTGILSYLLWPAKAFFGVWMSAVLRLA